MNEKKMLKILKDFDIFFDNKSFENYICNDIPSGEISYIVKRVNENA